MSQHARRLDPPTSVAAARRAEQSGLCETDAEVFAEIVALRPGITLKEMGEVLSLANGHGLEWAQLYQVKMNRRSGDVRRKGLAHSKDEGGNALRWYPGREESQPSLF